MLPVRAEPLIVYYNQDVFTKLNLPAPQEGWSWSDFSDLASRMKASGYSTGFPPELMDVEPIIRGLGGIYTSEDSRKFTGYTDSEATIQAFKRLVDINGDRVFSSPYDENPNLALGFGRPSMFLPSVRSEVIDLKYAPTPLGLDGRAYNNMRLTGLSINKETSNPELAWRFLETVLGETDEMAMHSVGHYTLGLLDHVYLQNPHPEDNQLLETLFEEIANAFLASPDVEYNPQPWTSNPFKLSVNVVHDSYYKLMDDSELANGLRQPAFKLDQEWPSYYQTVE